MAQIKKARPVPADPLTSKDFQKVIHDDADLRDSIQGAGVVIVECHQSWCGPCECVRPTLWRLSLDDESLKFCVVC
jgi:thiol-disulfide isomerase/thioredoxin